VQLPPDPLGAVDAEVVLVDPVDLYLQLFVAERAGSRALDSEVGSCEDALVQGCLAIADPGRDAFDVYYRFDFTQSTRSGDLGPCPMHTGSAGQRGFPNRPHAKQSVRSGSGSGGCGRFVKSKSYERSVASRSRSVNRESPQLVSMNRRTLENSPS